jgi:hypothetical protein
MNTFIWATINANSAFSILWEKVSPRTEISPYSFHLLLQSFFLQIFSLIDKKILKNQYYIDSESKDS